MAMSRLGRGHMSLSPPTTQASVVFRSGVKRPSPKNVLADAVTLNDNVVALLPFY